MGPRTKRFRAVAMIALAGIALAAGCATMRVSSYAERGVDLRQYRTYGWAPPDAQSTGDPRLDNNRFFDERVRARVDNELARRGFQKAAADPDLLVHYHANVTQEIDVRDLDPITGVCPDERCQPSVYDKGTLIVDLVESRTQKLVWRGWAESAIDGVIDNQSAMESLIDEAVAKILTSVPSQM